MKSNEPPAPARPLVLKVGSVANGKYYAAFEPIPFDAETIPDSLRPYLAEDSEPEPPGRPRLNFENGRVYDVNAEGAILSRAGRRDAIRLAGEAATQARAEAEAIAANELDPQTAEILQEKHDDYVAGQIKAVEVAQARRDAAYAQAEEAAKREAVPEKPPEFFAKRGAVFMHAEKANLRPGEQVFTRQPNGQWWVAGIIDANGQIPLPPEVL